LILNTYVGTDKTGMAALGNSAEGIMIQGASNTTIGGTTGSTLDVISGGRSDGIFANTTGNMFRGNYIGLNAAGTAALGNAHTGLVVYHGSNAITGNVISGNGGVGLVLGNFDPAEGGNLVHGNRIGTDPSGTVAIPNGSHGIFVGQVAGGVDNRIGGTSASERNVISGNLGDGIQFAGAGA